MKSRRLNGRTQRGFGIFIVLLLAGGLAASAAMFTFYRTDRVAAEQTRRTSQALELAREGLIGYAATQGGASGTSRPGELPCPDTDGDGFGQNTCAAGALGLLPWRTLGIPEPRDAADAPIWYAVAGPFRNFASNPNSINSDTQGNLVVQALHRRVVDGQVVTDRHVLTNTAAAVLIAPGAPLGTQTRGQGEVLCTLTGGLLSARLCPSNFVDSLNGINNGAPTAANGFIAADSGGGFNDKVLYVEMGEFLASVEARVGNELRKLLQEYRANSSCRCYPWADSWRYSGGIADVHMNRGRFPTRPYPENWGEGKIPALPQWIVDNDWHNRVWYTASRYETHGGGSRCKYCSSASHVTLDGQPVGALIILPGAAANGINRTHPSHIDVLANYLDDPQNNSKGTCPGWQNENANSTLSGTPVIPAHCDIYVQPTGTGRTRDRAIALAAGSRSPGSGSSTTSNDDDDDDDD